MATHSGILAWRIPWTEEPGGAPVCGVTKSRQTRLSNYHYVELLLFLKSLVEFADKIIWAWR